MKRFTETTKWDDPWFWELSPPAKLLWLFLCDHCNHAGIVEISLKIASAKIGQPINEKHLAELSNRLHALEGSKFLIRTFVKFQYGALKPDCKPHLSVITLLEQHGISLSDLQTVSKHYTKGSGTLQDQVQDKDKDKEGGTGETRIEGSSVLPEVLAVDHNFVAAWVKWLEHLKQKRKPATLHAQDLQLLKLSKMGPVKAIQTIDYCIEKNWQGIYEEQKHGNTAHQQSNPRRVDRNAGTLNAGKASQYEGVGRTVPIPDAERPPA